MMALAPRIGHNLVRHRIISVLIAVACSRSLAAQTRWELLGNVDAGSLKGVGAVGAIGGTVIMRHGGAELRVGASRFGMATGCDGFCDLTDATVAEVGAGLILGSRPLTRAWTAGALIARVSERNDAPRPMGALYIRRPWPVIGALSASAELRAHVVPVRGHGTGAGWALRLGLGLGAGAPGARRAPNSRVCAP